MHKDYSPVGYGDHPRSRNAHGVRVFDYENNRPVCVTHMHGLRDLNGKMDTPERAVQAQRLLDMSRRISRAGDLCVVCGDFNVEPDSETLKILVQAGLTELVAHWGFPSTRNSFYKKPGKFADYMLVSDKDEVQGFRVIYDPEVSDHCPLVIAL